MRPNPRSIPGNFCIALYLLVSLVGTPAYAGLFLIGVGVSTDNPN